MHFPSPERVKPDEGARAAEIASSVPPLPTLPRASGKLWLFDCAFERESSAERKRKRRTRELGQWESKLKSAD